jgi:dihydrofolate reductase
MVTVIAIAGVSTNNTLGKDNQLPWHLPADLRYFKNATQHHSILMGRKTYDSIGRPLPNRQNLVLSRQTDLVLDGCNVVNNLQQGIKKTTGDKLFVIGGETLYKQYLQHSHYLYLTKIDVDIKDGDAFFPSIDTDKWQLLSEEAHLADEKNPHDYRFLVYKNLAVEEL